MNTISIAIDDVPEGSVLVQAQLDPEGRVLLAAGTALSAGLLDSLRRRGVLQVTLAAPAESAPGVDPEVLKERTRLRLQHLFRHTLKQAELNPLLLIVPTYRQGGAP